MKSLFLGLVLCALIPLASSLAASEPESDSGLQAMAGVSFLEGRWEGDGWIQRGPQKSNFHGVEAVEKRLDGRILTIEGRHWADDPKHPIHQAFAVVSADASGSGYRFHSYLADGRAGDYAGRLEGGAFVWEMDIPNAGPIRYTIRVGDGVWEEIGEMSSQGKWMQFFGMTLKRQP